MTPAGARYGRVMGESMGPELTLLLGRRPPTLEDAEALQRLGHLYRFGVPDLSDLRGGDPRPLSACKRIVT